MSPRRNSEIPRARCFPCPSESESRRPPSIYGISIAGRLHLNVTLVGEDSERPRILARCISKWYYDIFLANVQLSMLTQHVGTGILDRDPHKRLHKLWAGPIYRLAEVFRFGIFAAHGLLGITECFPSLILPETTYPVCKKKNGRKPVTTDAVP